MQALFDESEEGGVRGLGISRAGWCASGSSRPLKVPHMGWNTVRFVQDRAPPSRRASADEGESFYFVHSFHCVPGDRGLVLAECDYGAPFVAAIAHGRLFATQFHPEKSQAKGIADLSQFRGISSSPSNRLISPADFVGGAQLFFASGPILAWLVQPMPHNASIKLDDKEFPLSVLVGTEGEKAIDTRKLRADTGLYLLRPGLREHGLLRERHHLPGRRQRHPAAPGNPDRAAGPQQRLRRDRLPDHLRGAARTRRSGRNSGCGCARTRRSRRRCSASSRASRRTRRRWRCCPRSSPRSPPTTRTSRPTISRRTSRTSTWPRPSRSRRCARSGR